MDLTNGTWCEMINYDRTLLRNMMANKEHNPARYVIAIVDGETKICDNDEHAQMKIHTIYIHILHIQSSSDLHETNSPEKSDGDLENSEDSSVWKSYFFYFCFYMI